MNPYQSPIYHKEKRRKYPKYQYSFTGFAIGSACFGLSFLILGLSLNSSILVITGLAETVIALLIGIVE
jgi:hypothetical protein